MDGIKKTALFLSGLEWKTVDLLLGRLEPDTARAVRREMMSLGNVSEKESDRLAKEFLRRAGRRPAEKRTTYAAPPVRRASVGSIPVMQAPTAESFETRFSNPFDFLRDENPKTVAAALETEHPQTVAAVLSHLPRGRSADVLRRLPRSFRNEVADRIAAYESTDAQILSEIAAALRERFRRRTPQSSFDDLERLGDAELSDLFHSVDIRTAVLALIGARPSLIERVTKRFSPTREHQMRQELKRLGPFDEQDIAGARHALLDRSAICR